MTAKKWQVQEKRSVLADYAAIAEHIERWTGDRRLADGTVDRIRTFIRGLARLPHRGTKRDDLRLCLRIVPFERRTAIAFEIDDKRRVVTILRVFHGGQDYQTVLREDDG